METNSLPFDACIVGGGPAGSAAAIRLAQAGWRVMVLARESPARPTLGEMLPAAARPLLEQLGLWRRFVQQAHAAASPVLVAWGKALDQQPFTTSPQGAGWLLDRRQFDALLQSAAAERCRWVTGRLLDCRRGSDGGWQVTLQAASRAVQVAARMLVDGSGRAAGLARRQGARRIEFDRLVARIADGPRPAGTVCEAALIEAVADGWWYSAPLPGDRMLATWFTDWDLCRSYQRDTVRGWLKSLDTAPLTRRRWGDARPVGLRAAIAGTQWTTPCSGLGWLAVGDAAVAFDPLSSQGLCQALRSGIEGAETLLQVAAGQTDACVRYAAGIRRTLATHLAEREFYYGRAAKFERAEFWLRRGRAGTGLPAS